MSEPEAIKASDLVRLMEVVKAATGVYNALERDFPSGHEPNLWDDWAELGNALRDLGLIEVT